MNCFTIKINSVFIYSSNTILPRIARSLHQGAGADPGGGHGGPMPPFQTEHMRNAKVYCALMESRRADLYMYNGFMSCEHRGLKYAAPKIQLPQTQRLILKERGSEKRPYDESCMVMLVSDGLRNSLTQSQC